MKTLQEKLAEFDGIETDLNWTERALTRNTISADIKAKSTGSAEDVRNTLEISELESQKLALMIEILDHPQFESLIEEGFVTFGMVKPEVNKAKTVHNELDDEVVAEMVKASIKEPLNLLMSQDFAISLHDAEDFYSHLNNRPEVFERVTKWMASGAVTGLVLFNPVDNAIAEWRSQMGPTNPAKADAEGRTDRIRHKFSDSVENNAVHGSDSIESVKREIAWFKRHLETLAGLPHQD